MLPTPIPRLVVHGVAAPELDLSTGSASDDDGAGDDDADADGLDEDALASENKRQLLMHLLPDLARTADELVTRLRHEASGSRLAAAMTDQKRRHFLLSRQIYQVSESPFVDWPWPADTEEPTSVSRTLARVNLASALDTIRSLRINYPGHALSFFKELDASFPSIFTPPGLRPHSLTSAMALAIRTSYLVLLLANQTGRTTPKQTIASVFCKATKSTDYAAILAHGPFRALGGEDADMDAEMCSQRATDLFKLVGRGKKALNLNALTREFPISESLGRLEKWALEQYDSLGATDAQSGPEHDGLHDDQESLAWQADEQIERADGADVG